MLDQREAIGGNNPPDPIDEALAPYGDYISEAESWLDGEPVSNEEQMKAVDGLLKQIKSAKSDVSKAEKSACLPLHDAWKKEKARWKPTLDDLDRMAKGLASLTDAFKRDLTRKRDEERRAAEAEARRKREEAEAAARTADAGDIEAQRLAAAAMDDANAAQKAAKQIESVKGMRTVTRYEITDHKAALHWIARNFRDDITAFVDEWVRKNHKQFQPEGVRVWTEKEAF